MEVTIGPTGQLARVTATSPDELRVFFELRDGRTGWLDSQEHAFEVGDILLISDDHGQQSADKVPSSTWPDELWIGIIKIKLSDVTVVESNGRLRTIPTKSEPNYDIGNTVLAGDTQGVTRVLHKTPISRFDLPTVDDQDIEGFRWKPSDDNKLEFDDFGGLTSVVKRARELIEVPLQQQQTLLKMGARPIKGVLFTGEPGTGKTLLARIIASQSQAAFFEISGPAIFSKWYGQSEELLRKLFKKAGDAGKAIIFFDELDSVAAQRDNTSHEASQRVVAQLLTLMDGFKTDTNVIVIAATNRPQALDIALRRPGRFDWEIEFPYPSEADREDILAKSARKYQIQISLHHSVIANKTDGWSAAELAAIWSEAALLAVGDKRCQICNEDYVGGFERVSRRKENAALSNQYGNPSP